MDHKANRLQLGWDSFTPLLHAHRIEGGHHGAQASAYLLCLVFLLALPRGFKPLAARLVFSDPFAGVGPVLDFLQHLPHGSPGLIGDDARAASVIAMLRGIAY